MSSDDCNRLREEIETLKKEKEALQLGNSRLILIAKKLQEEKNGYQKVIDGLDKRMDMMTTAHKELEDKFIFKFKILKIGVKEILQDAPEKRIELNNKIKDCLNIQQPSMFVKEASIRMEEDEGLVDAVDSLLMTLEKPEEPLDSTTVTQEDVEKLIQTLEADHADSQKFVKTLKDKITTSKETETTVLDKETQDDITMKWEPLEETKKGEETELTPGSGSNTDKSGHFVLIRVPDFKDGKGGWKFTVGKLLSQAKISKKDGIGKIYKVDYYKRQVAWDSFQPFKLNEHKKGFVVDEEDIALQLPSPFNISRHRLVRFDFNFKDYNVPY